ncbi:MAG TPA: hypothetical protein VEK57_29420 [Thermoanaerobaculia bacterium]|nr:hypothetical protein [Thermoanaerobaculia bacterium]
MLLAPLLLAAALTGNWTTHGPHGGGMNALAAATADARVLYAGNSGGVFRSDDGGRTWRDASGEASKRLQNVTKLAVHPSDPQTVYAAKSLHEYAGEVYKTVDGGAHWTRLTLPQPLIPRSIEVDPSDPDTVYVASDCQLYFAKGPRAQFHEAAGVYRSTDGGASWVNLSGVAWTPVCSESLTLDPLVPSHLFARTDFNGMYESTDRGATWQSVQLVPTEGVVAHPDDPSLRYGITHRSGPLFIVSTDGGGNWVQRPVTGVTGHTYLVLRIDPSTGRLFLGTDEGLFRSGDGGHSWLKINAVPPIHVRAVAVNAATREIFVASAAGLYASPFFYGTAVPVSIADAGTNVTRVARDPREPLRLFALTDDVFTGTTLSGRVFRSVNGGLTWELVRANGIEAHSKGAVDAAGDLYASRRGASTVDRLRRDGSVFETLPHQFNFIDDVIVDPVRPGVVYVFDLSGLHRTLDGGITWEPWGVSGEVMDIHPAHPDAIVVVSYGWVYTTTDGGRNWLETGITGQRPNPVAFAPSNPSVIYLTMERGEPGNPSHVLGQSTDGGRTFRKLSPPVPAPRAVAITALAVDPEDPNRVWAATSAGVFVTANGGVSWTDATANLPFPTVIHSLTIDPERGIVHLGTNHSVWSLGLGGRRRAVR